MKKILLCLFVLLCVVPSAWAKSLYVSTTGNDSTTYAANDIDHPWLTVERALEDGSLAAGDIIYFRTGTYDITGTITPTRSGSAGNPITVTRYGSESVTWQTPDDWAESECVEAIRLNVDYWTFSYMTWLYRTTNNIVDPGGDKGFLKLGEDSAAIYITLDHITGTSTAGGDNFGIVHAKGASDHLTITNCTFTVPSSSSFNGNTAAIIVFLCDYVDIRNCKLVGGRTTLYFKHMASTDVNCNVENNWITSPSVRKLFHTNSHYMTITNNIFDGPGTSWESSQTVSLWADEGSSTSTASYNVFNHNTVHGGFGFIAQSGGYCSYNQLSNSIIVGSIGFNPYVSTAHHTTGSHNLFASGSSLRENNTAAVSLATFQDTHSGDEEFPNSIADTPVFVGGSTFNTPSDYALTAGSPGKASCADGSDMGANVALVGPDAGSSDTTDPTVTITTNNGSDHGTSTQTISLAGSASDNVLVSSVSWACATCTPTSGSATGTTEWTITSGQLALGANTITVTATDSSSNTGNDSIVVTYGPPSASGCTISGTYK